MGKQVAARVVCSVYSEHERRERMCRMRYIVLQDWALYIKEAVERSIRAVDGLISQTRSGLSMYHT
jgi:hypothetical protein